MEQQSGHLGNHTAPSCSLEGEHLLHSQDWVGHLVAGKDLGHSWGYAVFYSPELISEGISSVRAAHDRLVDLALRAVGADEITTGMRFHLQQLPEPQNWTSLADRGDNDQAEDADSFAEGSAIDHLAESSIIDVAEAHNAELSVTFVDLALCRVESTTCASLPEQETASRDVVILVEQDSDSEDERTLGSDSTRSMDEGADSEPMPVPEVDPELDLSDHEDSDMRDDADIDLVEILPELRRIFANCGKSSDDVSHGPELLSGLQRNVFIVIDQDSADTFKEDQPADNAWVWAIDPAYDSDMQADPATVHGLRDVYQGYMRVRLQQLVNHFYHACRFRPDLTLRDLWKLTSMEAPYDFAFVKYEPGFEFSFDHDVGSALRPGKNDHQR